MNTEQDQIFDPAQLRLGERFWGEAHSLSRDRLLALLEQHSRWDKRFSATVFAKYSTELKPLDALLDAGNRFCTASARTSNSARAGVLELAHSKHGKAHVAVVAGHMPDVWLLVSDASRSSDVYTKLIEPTLRVCASRIANAWLSTRQFESIVLGMSDRTKLPLTPIRVSSVQRDGSTIRFPRETTGRELFKRLERDEAVLRSLDFRLGEAGRTVMKAALDRGCRMQYRGGFMRTLEEHLLIPLEAHTQKHFRKLDICRSDCPVGTEIRFKFRREVMADTTANRRLVDALGRLRRASVNAYHADPYLHVAIVDLWDGSTMDLFAHEADELLVIPGRGCSGKSISRVFDHIYDCFAAGEIEDVAEASTPLEGGLTVA